MFPALLTAAWLLCACAPTEVSSSSSNLSNSALPDARISHPQSDVSQKKITYTKTDVWEAFNRSDTVTRADFIPIPMKMVSNVSCIKGKLHT